MTCLINLTYPPILILITMIVCDKVAPAEVCTDLIDRPNTYQELIDIKLNSKLFRL